MYCIVFVRARGTDLTLSSLVTENFAAMLWQQQHSTSP